MTVIPSRLDDLLREGAEYLRECGVDSAALSAELLLAWTAGLRRLDVLIHPERELSSGDVGTYRDLIRRRGHGEPVAYILGSKEFYGREFKVAPGVLVPRPETELAVDLCLEIADSKARWKVVDICAGSGNLGTTLCCEFPLFHCLMADISSFALAVARENALRLGVGDRAFVCQMDFAFALKPGSVDLAVCNPPYISPAEYATLDREVANFEPGIALDGGVDGLQAPLAAVRSIAPCLRPGGIIILETGSQQARTVARRMLGRDTDWSDVRVIKDLRGDDRCVMAKKL